MTSRQVRTVADQGRHQRRTGGQRCRESNPLPCWTRERGAASLAEVVLVAPALLLALMLIVQFGLYFHARNIAEQAAQEGAAAARQFDGSEKSGHTQATQFLSAVGTKTLQDRAVTVDRSLQSATVTVTGTVISLVPGLKLHVKETATGPVERFVPAEDAP